MATSRQWQWDLMDITSPRFFRNLQKLNLLLRLLKAEERQDAGKKKILKVRVMFSSRISWYRRQSYGENQTRSQIWSLIPLELDLKASAEPIVQDFLVLNLWQGQRATHAIILSSETRNQSSIKQWKVLSTKNWIARAPARPKIFMARFNRWSCRNTMISWVLLITTTIRACSSQFLTNTDLKLFPLSGLKTEWTQTQSVLRKQRARSKRTRKRAMNSLTLTRERWRIQPTRKILRTCHCRTTIAPYLQIPKSRWRNLFMRSSWKESQKWEKLRRKTWILLISSITKILSASLNLRKKSMRIW